MTLVYLLQESTADPILMNPESIAWLNQFSPITLDDRQRYALVYLGHNDSITNREYRRLNRVDTTAAGQELRRLVQTKLIEQKGVGRWTTYTLETSLKTPKREKPEKDEDKILSHVKAYGSINNAECRILLGVDDTRAYYLLIKLCKNDILKPEGKGKGRRYVMS